MTTMATVRGETRGDVSVARVEGEIDAANVLEVGARIRSLVTNRSMRLVIDLSQVTYLDSAGINVIFAIGEELRSHQQTLDLVVAEGSPIARMLAITSLDRAHLTHPSLAHAIPGD
jgi:anti-anti-sigma factor